MINWTKIKKEDMQIALQIAKRANRLYPRRTIMDFDMDIEACHLSNPLRLKELLEADEFNFAHDIYGIMNNLNRETGKLQNCFLPRFSK
jgi:hypothetical protein